MTIWGLILRALLLLALLATMSVPNGFMRASGPDGMILVLCTAEGPQEILLDPSGNQVPDTGSEDAAAACVLSGIVPTLVPTLALTRTEGAAHMVCPWPQRHQVSARTPPHRAATPRAPPVPV
ncbi:hypothetical protein [Donghicola sp. XS_ASV15]|uniref:hypothetical protein n=1 Tax=Donghicola sp. XS_ASV15 TaxID=3241295 RepID=UPI003512C851